MEARLGSDLVACDPGRALVARAVTRARKRRLGSRGLCVVLSCHGSSVDRCSHRLRDLAVARHRDSRPSRCHIHRRDLGDGAGHRAGGSPDGGFGGARTRLVAPPLVEACLIGSDRSGVVVGVGGVDRWCCAGYRAHRSFGIDGGDHVQRDTRTSSKTVDLAARPPRRRSHLVPRCRAHGFTRRRDRYGFDRHRCSGGSAPLLGRWRRHAARNRMKGASSTHRSTAASDRCGSESQLSIRARSKTLLRS